MKLKFWDVEVIRDAGKHDAVAFYERDDAERFAYAVSGDDDVVAVVIHAGTVYDSVADAVCAFYKDRKTVDMFGDYNV